jgi:hypothetical protein
MVNAAEQYAARLAAPASDRMPATRCSSRHNAAKGLRPRKHAHTVNDEADSADREQQHAQPTPADT